MKCPYRENRIKVIKQKIEHNEYRNQSIVTETQMDVAEMIDCIEENCAAYHNGKCCYFKGVS